MPEYSKELVKPTNPCSEFGYSFRSRDPTRPKVNAGSSVDLRGCFSNPRKPLESLISRVLEGSQARRPRARGLGSPISAVLSGKMWRKRLAGSTRSVIGHR